MNRAYAHRRAEMNKFEESVFMGDQAQFIDTASDWRSTPEDIESAAGPFITRQTAYYKSKGLDPRAAALKANQLYQEAMRGNIKSRLGMMMRENPAEFQRVIDGLPAASPGGGKKVEGARFDLPTDNHHYITSPFGPRPAPKTPKGLGSGNHQGIDLRMPVGTPVKAISGGTVDFAGEKGGYGVTVVIKHDDGTSTSQYGHLSKLNVKPGTRIQAGEIIALSGNTGKSTGPHLDLKVTENGKYVDPAPLLGITRKGLAGPPLKSEGEPIMLASLDGGPVGVGASVSRAAEQGPELKEAEEQASGSTWVVSDDAALANEFLIPQDRLELEKKWEIIQKDRAEAAANQEVDRQYKELKDAVGALPFDEQVSAFNESIAEYPHETRENMSRRFKQDLDFLKTRQEARDQVAMGKYLEYAEGQGLTPSETIAGLNSIENISPEGREKLRKKLEAGTVNKETPENQAALSELRAAIDNDGIAAQEGLEAFAYEHGLTARQVNNALAYWQKGGQSGMLRQETVNRAFKSLQPKGKVPGDLFDLVLGQLKPGEHPGYEAVKKVVANLYMDGEAIGSGLWWDRDESYLDAFKKGRGQSWLPDVTGEEKAAISGALKKMGLASPTDEEIRKFKKYEIMGLPYQEDR